MVTASSAADRHYPPTLPLSRTSRQALGFDLQASSFLAFLPWLVMAFGSPASGLLADHLVACGVPVVTARKALQVLHANIHFIS